MPDGTYINKPAKYKPLRANANRDDNNIIWDAEKYEFDISIWITNLLACPAASDLATKLRYYICKYFVELDSSERVCTVIFA